MSLILNGTDGLSDVDGTAATPAIRGTDANTGIFFPAADTIAFSEGGVEAARFDASGNLGIGTSSPAGSMQLLRSSDPQFIITDDANSSFSLGTTTGLSIIGTDAAAITFKTGVTTGSLFSTGTEQMRITSGNNLLIGQTTTSAGADGRLSSTSASGSNIPAATFKSFDSNLQTTGIFYNAATTGDNRFIQFATESTYTDRGQITYNRGAGLVVYGTTSDYRSKDIISPVLNSGEVIDSVPVYMGKMKGATQARPMFIAHETPDYAHTGEKDAVDKEGNPVYQQMDASSLVPVLWAEIQSLRKRIAALESAKA